MITVFMAYSRQDQILAQRLAQELTVRGARIWLDFERLVPGTVDWESSIRDGINSADYVLYLASPSARQSAYTNAEIILAQQHAKRIIPIWVDGEHFVDAAPLSLSGIQYLDARGNRFEEALEKLTQALGLIAPPPKTKNILIFLSYARVDVSIVNTLKNDLRQRDVKIWVDHERLKAGAPDWQEAIRRGIQLVDQLVYVASPAARKSPNVNAELMLAYQFKKPIIPFWISGESWIDAAVFSLSLAQYINACGSNYAQALKQLVERLEFGEETEVAI